MATAKKLAAKAAARKPAAKSAAKTAAKSAAKSAARPALKPAAKPASKPAAKPVARASSVGGQKLKVVAEKGRGVHGQVIVAAGVARGNTGAQRIAADHSPRAALRKAEVAHAAAAAANTRQAVEQFLYHQSELLDQQQWQAYIDLFADEGIYWMPILPEQKDWESEPSIFAEDKDLMRVRMGRVTHPNAWSQAPMWATNHLVGNIVIESETAKEVTVRSRFHMMELRRDSVRHFGGTYRHRLAKRADGFRILMQRVDLFNGQAPFDYVLQVWV